jgi:D-glycero-D-manno-heptose 1,7-bisphosphate phosphatase
MSTTQARPAVFVDRDRTLIDDPGYISDPDQVRLLDGAAESLRRFRDAGYAVVIVTNQSGVARGLLTEGDLAIVHQRMRDLLRSEGTDVDAIYYCPFLDGPEAVRDQYRRDSNLRKPKPGMLLLAAEELGLDLGKSWMIGDSARDVQAGRAAGCRTILISGETEEDGDQADFVAADLHAATDHVLAGRQSLIPAGSGDVQSELNEPARTGDGRDLADERPADEPVVAAQHEPVGPVSSWRRPAGATQREPSPPGAEMRPAGSHPAESPAAADSTSAVEEGLGSILEELRIMRRERQYEDFSIGKLAGAIFEAFALCATAWGLCAWVFSSPGPDPEKATSATIWLLGAIVFQLMALTCVVASHKK